MGREAGKSGMERMRKEDKGSSRVEDASLRSKWLSQSCALDSNPVCVLHPLCCSCVSLSRVVQITLGPLTTGVVKINTIHLIGDLRTIMAKWRKYILGWDLGTCFHLLKD